MIPQVSGNDITIEGTCILKDIRNDTKIHPFLTNVYRNIYQGSDYEIRKYLQEQTNDFKNNNEEIIYIQPPPRKHDGMCSEQLKHFNWFRGFGDEKRYTQMLNVNDKECQYLFNEASEINNADHNAHLADQMFEDQH